MSLREVAVALIVASCAAWAQSPKEVAERVLKDCDKNKDGRITEKECPDEGMLRRYDANKDRVITREEIEKAEEEARERMRRMGDRPRGINAFLLFDTDADGELSAKEFGDWLFAELDRDYDEVLTTEELSGAYVPAKLRGGANPLVMERKKLDRDDDGVVDRKEWEVPKSYFGAFDRDRSGTVSKDEVVMEQIEAMGGLPGFSGVDMFERRDKNRDKQLSNNEFEGTTDLFDRIDADKDKAISIEEYNAYMDRLRSVMRNADDVVVRFDLNGDGKVTRAEFPGSDAAFDRADTNGDGLLTRTDQAPRR